MYPFPRIVLINSFFVCLPISRRKFLMYTSMTLEKISKSLPHMCSISMDLVTISLLCCAKYSSTENSFVVRSRETPSTVAKCSAGFTTKFSTVSMGRACELLLLIRDLIRAISSFVFTGFGM